ncbi:D-alanyl-D-alanine carboxypeptidase/D-alanyl-D-alanine-endopeptidase [Corynebacterium timonense]|uniref:D-alanyl-D-alanine carboxypeptidase / D-alanyl-D-alanine-endopeptidase (Penicillin-binding protein 4) n=1 Tax=Corynebacterium timonense TaxID=441500 RepID=A0A1H1L415_9CORY|nr:D-alanyl-D-alanine carboxypeptidase/D-alanyl-D-alanine-endopeptidase [Corynebacterium timonense]SDR69276.1 D-alanyl-D-alanine carboxypeptidase / D-alanyl-D-alanine-endopeptidase (penicillin-binding protein 4) [Corynebacterium timonense]
MKVWTWAVGAAAVISVGAVAGIGVSAQQQRAELTHAPAFELTAPAPIVEPASPSPIDATTRAAEIARLAADPALGTFHARISSADTGEVIFDQLSADPLRPASTTKVLTAAAALLELGPADTITTDVVAGKTPGQVVIKAAGDVWFDEETLDRLAAEIGSADAVYVDTSAWPGETLLPGWDPVDIDAGFVAPLEPIMLHGGRIGATEGDVPRSHTPALDVARALAERLGADVADYGAAPAGAQVLASAESPDLTARLKAMMKDSDNVMAEAIGREVAAHRGAASPQATLDALAERGYDTTAVTLADGSGLSTFNLIPPRLLDELLVDAARAEPLRPLLSTLPVAHGEGTLAERYADLPGRGWVRAKTGTLDSTSALAGTVTSREGNVYTFAFISNGSDILAARRALDELASVLREF